MGSCLSTQNAELIDMLHLPVLTIFLDFCENTKKWENVSGA